MTTDSTPNVNLDDFCVTLSARDRRVELIGAFHHSQKVSGQLFDTPENFQERFDEFATAPV